jgi:hypothetical protein
VEVKLVKNREKSIGAAKISMNGAAVLKASLPCCGAA